MSSYVLGGAGLGEAGLGEAGLGEAWQGQQGEIPAVYLKVIE